MTPIERHTSKFIRTRRRGSLFILCVMLVPGSPSRLVWPLEWFILGTLSVTGIGFWFAARGYRQRVSEADRAQLILEDYAS